MKETVIKLVECGKEVGCIRIPETYSGKYWNNIKEICCPCNYIINEGVLLFVQNRNCSCANDCYWSDREINESCSFQGNAMKLPAGSIVEFYKD